MLRTYTYSSSVKQYIEDFVAQKRANGYKYEFEAYVYLKFDEYCIRNDLTVSDFTKNNLLEWMTIRDSESKGYFSQRISFVRQFLLYLNTIGIIAYIPKNFIQAEKGFHIFLVMKKFKVFLTN